VKDDPVHVAEGIVFSQLTWWKDNSWKYPLLAKLAMNLLSAPAMSTEVKKGFSSTGITDSDLRNQLLMRAMEASEYCEGAKWHGGALMLISQFMGRLENVNRTPKTTDRQTDRQRDAHRRIQFNSILFYSDVCSRSV
jgi:hAT family C-terminal dimerisation region